MSRSKHVKGITGSILKRAAVKSPLRPWNRFQSEDDPDEPRDVRPYCGERLVYLRSARLKPRAVPYRLFKQQTPVPEWAGTAKVSAEPVQHGIRAVWPD